MEESKINKLAQIQRVNPIAGGLRSWPAIPNICNNLKSPREYEIELICVSLSAIQLYQTSDYRASVFFNSSSSDANLQPG